MKKTTYNCKQNDAVIRLCSDNGEIQELWVKIKGETTWTVIGYFDLLNAIDKAHSKIMKEKTECPIKSAS